MDPLFFVALVLGLTGVVGLVEHALYGGMNRVYYTHGLPFVIRRIPVSAAPETIPPPSLLQEQFRSALIGSLAFHPVAPHTYGFRRQFFQSAWLPGTLMHGMLRFDCERQQVVVKGFLNAWITLLVLAVLLFSLLGPLPGWTRLVPVVIAAVVIGLPVLLERRRCGQVARFAASAWKGG